MPVGSRQARTRANKLGQERQRNEGERGESSVKRTTTPIEHQQTKPKQTAAGEIIPEEAWKLPPNPISNKVKDVKEGKSETSEAPPRGRRRRVTQDKPRNANEKTQSQKPVQVTNAVEVEETKGTSESEKEGAFPLRGRRKGPLVTKPGIHTHYHSKKIEERHIKRISTKSQHSTVQTKTIDEQNPSRQHVKLESLETKAKDDGRGKAGVLYSGRSTCNSQGAINRELDATYTKVASLSKDDVSEKARFINDVVDKEIISKICEIDSRFTFDILHTGSYYEYLKVVVADEFDIMVRLNANKISNIFKVHVCPSRRHSHLVGFAYLEYQSHFDGTAKWRDLLVEGPDKRPVLSPEKILKLFKALLSQRLQNMNSSSKKPWGSSSVPSLHGPAVKLTFCLLNGKQLDVDIVLCAELAEWPSVANNWGVLHPLKWPSQAIVETIKKKGCHVVPKVNISDQRCWRLSFSLAEKSLLSPKAIDDDKKYYQIVKVIFERNKLILKPLCSYHLKTLFLHLRGSSRTFTDGIQFIEYFIEQLLEKVRDRKLPHYFIGHNLNLFSEMSNVEAFAIDDCLRKTFDSDRLTIREFMKDLKKG